MPYTDQLDKESSLWWADIKLNLGRAIALREVDPGIVSWLTRLSRYIKVYGYKFTKTDHLALVDLIFEYVISDDVEPWMVNKLCSVLVTLLKMKHLIERDELSLPWRPLYDLYERLMYSPYEIFGMMVYPE